MGAKGNLKSRADQPETTKTNFLQIEPKPDQANPRKRSWVFPDFLGFPRRIRDFSMGYQQSKQKM